MRDAAIAVLRVIGVETGGSNVQFAVDPATGRQVLIEMNPRVSRSSALASKATGFPIAKIAALLAVGYRLDEIMNDITGETPAAFEPTLDYVVVKIPRFAFEKFPEASPGAVLHDEVRRGDDGDRADVHRGARQGVARDREDARSTVRGAAAARPIADARHPRRPRRACTRVADPLAAGATIEEVAADVRRSTRGSSTRSPQVVRRAASLRGRPLHTFGAAELLAAKRLGLSDARIARSRARPRPRAAHRDALGVQPVFKTVDTCARGVPGAHALPLLHVRARPPRSRPRQRPRVVILGAGPNRIGQGIEFDYACVHAAYALRGGGVRVGDGQLEPGDGLDRLRHGEPPVLRAARRPRTCWPSARPSSRSA